MLSRQFFGCFVLVFYTLCDGIELNVTECANTCKKEIISNDDKLCNEICVEKSLGKLIQGYKRKLPKPAIPRIIEFDSLNLSIRLNFTTTELQNYSGLHYILELKRSVGNYSNTKTDVFTLFPYKQKYYLTNETTYSVLDLERDTGYQFRVIAVGTNESSEFSDWSDITRTEKNCSNLICYVSNMRVELTSQVPYKGMVELKSVFYWEPITLSQNNIHKYNIHAYVRNFKRLSPSGFSSWCASKFKRNRPQSEKKTLKEKNIFTNKNLTNYKPEKELIPSFLYYDCWYTFELYLTNSVLFPKEMIGLRKWTFHTPDCIKISESTICGCPWISSHTDTKHVLNVTVKQLNTSSIAYFYWSDTLWRDDVNITYYMVTLISSSNGVSQQQHKYYDAYLNVHNYNGSFPDLTIGKKYLVRLSVFHSDHCLHHQRESKVFFAKDPCLNHTCRTNSTCRSNFETGEAKCPCDLGFAEVGNRCIDLFPCSRETCGANQTCRADRGKRICDCKEMFVNKSGTCVLDKCKLDPKAIGCTTIHKATEKDNIAIIAGVVPALVVVILIAFGIVIWLRYFHKIRMVFMEREFQDAIQSGSYDGTLTNAYDFQHPIELAVSLPEGCSSKEMNLLYVLQKDLVIPEDLEGSIGLFELPGERVRLRSMIGKGAFGEVYIGEAQGVNNNPEWTTVAIKTLAEAVTEEDVHDFLREIELMKDLGKHENVIQMYGCCTRCRPICLVLEYASNGNLLNYLKSLKKKCKEIAAARAYAFINSEKGRFQRFFEPGEMPDPSTSYSFPHDPYKRPGRSEAGVKEAEALNLEVASQINEELRNALDPKELESFARQIACGMEHIASVGIVHRDLAARNILLDENKVLKISDFGLSREGTYVKRTRGKIPFRWLSIEAIVERFYSSASDVWAFGIVLMEICTLGDVPYPTVSDKDLEGFLLSGKRMGKVDSCTNEIYEIMLKCWSHFPEDRPSFKELSKWLWDLEHDGNTYVNVEGLVQQSDDDQGNENQAETQKDNNNIDDKTDAESEPNFGITSDEGLDNPGFTLSEENLNTSDEKQLLRQDKRSGPKTTPDNDENVGNVVTSVTNSVNVQ